MNQIILANTVSAGTTQNSGVLSLGDNTGYFIAIDFSGSDLAGTAKLQISSDNSDWIDLTDGSQSVTSAASKYWNISGAQYPYVRVSWTYTSGTGNWTVTATLKDLVVSGV